MSYTTPAAVQGLLGDNYGPLAVNQQLPDLQQFIDTAHVTVVQMVAVAARRGYAHSVAELEIIERWLAAHDYCQMDPLYMSRSTAGRSGSFQRGSAGGLNDAGFGCTEYGKRAVQLDASGALNSLGRRLNAKGFAVGASHE